MSDPHPEPASGDAGALAEAAVAMAETLGDAVWWGEHSLRYILAAWVEPEFPSAVQVKRAEDAADAFLLRLAVAALRSPRPGCGGTAWEPIATAPRDGKKGIVCLEAEHDDPLLLRYFKYNGLSAWRDADADIYHPVLWLRLPARDADRQGASGTAGPGSCPDGPDPSVHEGAAGRARTHDTSNRKEVMPNDRRPADRASGRPPVARPREEVRAHGGDAAPSDPPAGTGAEAGMREEAIPRHRFDAAVRAAQDATFHRELAEGTRKRVADRWAGAARKALAGEMRPLRRVLDDHDNPKQVYGSAALSTDSNAAVAEGGERE